MKVAAAEAVAAEAKTKKKIQQGGLFMGPTFSDVLAKYGLKLICCTT